MGAKLNKFLKGQAFTSVFYFFMGICLVFMPVGTVNLFCKVIFGLVLMGAGFYHIFIFTAEKESSTILDLFSGVIVFVIGLFLFSNPQVVVKLLPLMLGALILVDSIWTLRGCVRLRKRRQEAWKFFLAESLAFVVVGLFLMLYTFQSVNAMVMFAGWVFLVDGLLDAISCVTLKKGLDGDSSQEETDGEPAASEEGIEMEEAAEAEEAPLEEPENIPEWNSRTAPDKEAYPEEESVRLEELLQPETVTPEESMAPDRDGMTGQQEEILEEEAKWQDVGEAEYRMEQAGDAYAHGKEA